MALMFQRLAHNFIKNGYYPTDSDTTARILSALTASKSGQLRILDPCAGEGVALAECKHHLGIERTQAFGVEYDHERAWHAKGLLDRCIHGDVQDCNLGLRQYSLLWLNPPYGDLVSDKGSTGDTLGGKGRKRLEKLFYNLTIPTLQFEGVLVFIIPRNVLDKEIVSWITSHFRDVSVFKAPEQRFKQIVLFGVKRRTRESALDNSGTRERLLSIVAGETEPEMLPEQWQDAPYVVPAVLPGEVKFHYVKLDPQQLQDEIQRHRCLWDQFELRFRGHSLDNARRPLRRMTDWHLAQALVAGQVSGLVRSQDGRQLLVKGGTYKVKVKEVMNETSPDGDVSSTTIFTDRFVPTIRAIDFTPGINYARVIEIR